MEQHNPQRMATERIARLVNEHRDTWSAVASGLADTPWRTTINRLLSSRPLQWEAGMSRLEEDATAMSEYIEACERLRGGGRNAILAIHAWPDSVSLLDMEPGEVATLAGLGVPAAILLLSTVVALREAGI